MDETGDRAGGAPADIAGARRRLAEFRRGTTGERLFVQPTCHPALPTGFCWCEGSAWNAARFFLRAVLLGAAFRLPFNAHNACQS